MVDRTKDAREGVVQVNVRVPKERAPEIKKIAREWLRQYRAMVARGGAKQ